jgi:hypothetical protein
MLGPILTAARLEVRRKIAVAEVTMKTKKPVKKTAKKQAPARELSEDELDQARGGNVAPANHPEQVLKDPSTVGLGLQQAMQNENRQFTTVSNVMKTKHDTAKNAISNVR